MSRPHLLLLAGTAEARALARRLSEWPVDVTVSLAGATSDPREYAGMVRRGGFGGVVGLVAWMQARGVTALVDATHPFAERIAANAAAAASRAHCPFLRLVRPAWTLEAGDQWSEHLDVAAALAMLPDGARALLATGAGSAAALDVRPDLQLYLRSIEQVAALPAHVTPIQARPPFSVESERQLMLDLGITHLVTKNAGGAGRAKLDAAAELGLPVLMIRRPPASPTGEEVHDVEAALAWVARSLLLDTASGTAP